MAEAQKSNDEKAAAQAPETAPSTPTRHGRIEAIYAFPLRGTSHKIIHLIRHGQATSNAAAGGAKSHPAYMSWDYFDAALSPLGQKQAQDLGAKLGGTLKPGLIVVSPLTRAITTAQHVFGANKKLLAHELLRERMGVHPCDKRRKVSELEKVHKRVDFTLVEHDDDLLWRAKERETPAALEHRVLEFLHWLRDRKEREIAIVGHSGWFEALMNNVLKTFDPQLRQWFDNCELRSLHIVFSTTTTTAVDPVHPSARL